MRRLAPNDGSARNAVAWVLFDEGNLKYLEKLGHVVGQLERPEVPVDQRAGKYLMRVLVDPSGFSDEGYCVIDMVSARSLPHETVWSETAHAIETRSLIGEHLPVWPS